MNIIDTRTVNTLSPYNKGAIKNIPLFKLEPLSYELKSKNYTDIIFQSTPSVEFFNDIDLLENRRVFSMGISTKKSLADKGIDSDSPVFPGSFALNELLKENLSNRKFLIVKGLGGLNKIFNYLIKNDAQVHEIICYQRMKFDSYEEIKKLFKKSDAIIFPSTFAAKIFFEEIFSRDLRARYFVISERIKSFINTLGFEAYLIDYFSDDVEKSIKNLLS